MHIRLDVKLQAAGFTPTSEFRADLIASLSPPEEKQMLRKSRHKVIKKVSPIPNRDTLPHEHSETTDDRKLAYVICQLAGRWVTERNWMVPFVYDSDDKVELSVEGDHGGNVDSSYSHNSPSFTTTEYSFYQSPHVEDLKSSGKTGLDVPAICKAALDDALHWGSSGVEGYSGFIFKYPPQVIVTNQNISAEHSLVMRLSCPLPDYIPPTFRGTSIKYQYLLVMVAADANRFDKPQVSRIPWILTTSQATSVVRPIYIPWTKRPNYAELCNPSTRNSFRVHTWIMPSRNNIQRMIALSPNGRITPLNKQEENPRQFAVSYPVSEETIFECNEEQVTDGIAVSEDIHRPHSFPYVFRKDSYSANDDTQNVYQIKRDADIVCRIFMWKRAFCSGDSIVGFVEFSQSKVPCYRMTIQLETEERVHPKACNRVATPPLVFRKTYGEQIEYPTFQQNTEFIFTIPLDAPVSFETNAVSFLWQLHFTFQVPDGPVDAYDMKYNELLQIPLSETDYLLQRNTKLLNWCLPLVVYGGDRLAFVPDTFSSLDLLHDT